MITIQTDKMSEKNKTANASDKTIHESINHYVDDNMFNTFNRINRK